MKLTSNREENIVGKGENAGYQHFLLFPQCFQKASPNQHFLLFPQCFQKASFKGVITYPNSYGKVLKAM